MVKEYRLAYTGEEINERLSDEYMEGKTVDVLTTLESADEVDEIIAMKDGTLVKTAMSDIKSTSVKDYDQNDETHSEYIKNRPMYINSSFKKELLFDVDMGVSDQAGTNAGAGFLNQDYYILENVKNGIKYSITLYNNDKTKTYVFEGIGTENNSIKYVYSDNIEYFVTPTVVDVPMDIYREFEDGNVNIKLEEYTTNKEFVVGKDYLPVLQSDYNVDNENSPNFIKNRPIKEEYNYDEKFNENIKFEKYNNTYTNISGSGFQLNEGTECTVTLKSKIVKTMDCIVYPAYTNGVSSDKFISLKSATTYEEMSGFYITCDEYRLSIQLSEELYEEVCDSDNIDITVSVPTDLYLAKSDGTPLDKTFAIDSENYRYGDNLLKAIAGNRIPLIKIPNENDNDLYDNFVLPWQIQVPKNGNDYVNVFYTKDRFAQKLVALLIEILSTQDFTNLESKFGVLFGEMELQLHAASNEPAVKCEKPLD